MAFDQGWVEIPVPPADPIRIALEALGTRLGELDARARRAEERAERAEATCSSIQHNLFLKEKEVERLTAERDAAVADYFTRRPRVEVLSKRIEDALAVLDEHPRSGAKAAAILRDEGEDPE